MGLDVHLKPKNRNYDYSIEDNLSRRFCNFICGPDGYGKNCEFFQVQDLLQIDLSIFRKRAQNIESLIGELEYQIYLAEEESDLEKIKNLNEQIEQVKLDWDKNYDNNNEGWITIDQLEKVVTTFQKKLNNNPNFHDQIKYNFNWGDYLHPQRNQLSTNNASSNDSARASRSYVNNILFEDLNSILNWIASAKQKDINHVTFEFG